MLNAYQFGRPCSALVAFQAQFHHFTDPLHQGVEILGLTVTAAQGGDAGNIVAVLVTLNDDGELSGLLHTPILARSQGATGASVTPTVFPGGAETAETNVARTLLSAKGVSGVREAVSGIRENRIRGMPPGMRQSRVPYQGIPSGMPQSLLKQSAFRRCSASSRRNRRLRQPCVLVRPAVIEEVVVTLPDHALDNGEMMGVSEGRPKRPLLDRLHRDPCRPEARLRGGSRRRRGKPRLYRGLKGRQEKDAEKWGGPVMRII